MGTGIVTEKIYIQLEKSWRCWLMHMINAVMMCFSLFLPKDFDDSNSKHHG